RCDLTSFSSQLSSSPLISPPSYNSVTVARVRSQRLLHGCAHVGHHTEESGKLLCLCVLPRQGVFASSKSSGCCIADDFMHVNKNLYSIAYSRAGKLRHSKIRRAER